MKVLLVHNRYQQLGGEDVVFEQERHMLRASGDEVIEYERTNSELAGFKIFQKLALLPEIFWSNETHKDIKRVLTEHRPDIVHVHNWFVMISPSVFSACREAGVPVVQTLHNYRLLCSNAIFFRDGKRCEECMQHTLLRGIRYGCYHNSRAQTAVVALMMEHNRRRHTWDRGVDGFIALSDFSRRKFLEAGLPPEKVFVKPNFVFPDPGTQTEKRDYALFVGRLSPEKRIVTLLKAWARLKQSVPLIVIGDGPLRAEMQSFAERECRGSVSFLGQMDHSKTLEYMQGARFLIVSSEWYETFGLIIAEAFACGTPVICSRLGAMQEIVGHGKTGLHFEPGDPKELAESVEWAQANPTRLRDMGAAARLEYEAKYTAEKNYPILRSIYDCVLNSYKN